MQSRMRLTFAVAALVPSVALAQAPATSATALTPPVAAVRPHRFDEHGNVRVDPYYWLKDRNNPEVIKYLEDENAYTKAVMAHTQAIQESADRRNACRHRAACHRRDRLGRGQPHAVLHETRFHQRAAVSGLPAPARHVRGDRPDGLRRQG